MYSKIEDVEKTSCELYRSGRLKIVHSVKYGSNRYDGEKIRTPHHREYLYKSSAYDDKKKLISIKLAFSSFITVEIADCQKNLFLSNNNIGRFIFKLNKYLEYLLSPEQNAFFTKDGIVTLNSNSRKLIFVSGGSFKIETAVYTDTEDVKHEGVAISIDEEEEVIMHIEDFIGFAYVLNKVDLYQYGLEHVNYIAFPEEEVGTRYCTELNNTDSFIKRAIQTGGIASTNMTGRVIGGNKKDDYEGL